MGLFRKHYCSCGSGREVGFCGHGRDADKGGRRRNPATRAGVVRNGRRDEPSGRTARKAEKKRLRASGYGGIRNSAW